MDDIDNIDQIHNIDQIDNIDQEDQMGQIDQIDTNLPLRGAGHDLCSADRTKEYTS